MTDKELDVQILPSEGNILILKEKEYLVKI
jgi:hypothetical protein